MNMNLLISSKATMTVCGQASIRPETLWSLGFYHNDGGSSEGMK